MLYTETGEWNAARRHYTEALRLTMAVGSVKGEAYITNNMGVVYSSLGENEKALNRLSTSTHLFGRLGSAAQEARALLRLAHVLLGHWPEALDLADRVGTSGRASGETRLSSSLIPTQSRDLPGTGRPSGIAVL